MYTLGKRYNFIRLFITAVSIVMQTIPAWGMPIAGEAVSATMPDVTSTPFGSQNENAVNLYNAIEQRNDTNGDGVVDAQDPPSDLTPINIGNPRNGNEDIVIEKPSEQDLDDALDGVLNGDSRMYECQAASWDSSRDGDIDRATSTTFKLSRLDRDGSERGDYFLSFSPYDKNEGTQVAMGASSAGNGGVAYFGKDRDSGATYRFKADPAFIERLKNNPNDPVLINEIRSTLKHVEQMTQQLSAVVGKMKDTVDVKGQIEGFQQVSQDMPALTPDIEQAVQTILLAAQKDELTPEDIRALYEAVAACVQYVEERRGKEDVETVVGVLEDLKYRLSLYMEYYTVREGINARIGELIEFINLFMTAHSLEALVMGVNSQNNFSALIVLPPCQKTEPQAVK